MLIAFCQKLNWREFKILFEDYGKRLTLVQGEVASLLEIFGSIHMNLKMASQMDSLGIRDLRTIIRAERKVLKRCIEGFMPYFSESSVNADEFVSVLVNKDQNSILPIPK